MRPTSIVGTAALLTLLATVAGAQQVTLPLTQYEDLRTRANPAAETPPSPPAPFALEMADFDVTGHRISGAPGIYVRLEDPFGHAALVGPRPDTDPFRGLGKIAALGVKVSNHCTYHGVALNVAMDLQPFARINPCGYAGLETVDLATLGVVADPAMVADVLGRRLRAQFTR